MSKLTAAPVSVRHKSLCCITSDGALIITSTGTQHINFYTANTGQPLEARTLSAGLGNMVTSLCVSEVAWREAFIVAGCADGSIYVWTLSNGAVLHHLAGNNDAITALCASADGEHIVATDATSAVLRVWRFDDGALLSTLKGHTACITSVAVHPNGTIGFGWVLG